MDDRRFDDLARIFASGSSRRGLITGIAIGTISGALAGPRSLRGLAGGRAQGEVRNADVQISPGDCDCPEGCDDGDACTIDSCEDGRCVHKPIDCDDGDPCTDDRCINGTCVHVPIEGACCEDGQQACGEFCCDPNTQYCCQKGAEPVCCKSGVERCKSWGCEPFPPDPPSG